MKDLLEMHDVSRRMYSAGITSSQERREVEEWADKHIGLMDGMAVQLELPVEECTDTGLIRSRYVGGALTTFYNEKEKKIATGNGQVKKYLSDEELKKLKVLWWHYDTWNKAMHSLLMNGYTNIRIRYEFEETYTLDNEQSEDDLCQRYRLTASLDDKFTQSVTGYGANYLEAMKALHQFVHAFNL